MAKKKPRKGNSYNAKMAVHQQQWQRREIARLMACGYSHAEIGRQLDIHPNTMTREVRIVETQWWESQQVDTGTRITKEAAQLEFTRAEILRCFYEAANRHGETLQVGYMNCYAKLTDQLHTLLRLTDPLSSQTLRGDETVPVLEVEVATRDEARVFQGGTVNVTEFASILDGRPLSPAEPGADAEG